MISPVPAIIDEKSSITLVGREIPCRLYADDLLLFSDTRKNLQQILYTYFKNNYCNQWFLEIKAKTQVVIFLQNWKAND